MKRITVLVADDETEIADLVALHLEKEGYHVVKAADGTKALRMLQSEPIDLAILDIMMPGMDGYEVTRQTRGDNSVPILILSAKTSDFDKISGLVIGADDYMTKPFNPMELVARVNALLRRSMTPNRAETEALVLEAGGLVIDPVRRTVSALGENVDLTPKEFDILYLLAGHPGKVFGAENIFRHVWGEEYFESGNTVMVHIRTLRKKLGENKDKWIKTVWGVGYKFNG